MLFYRYKPFFVKTDPSQLDAEDNEIVPQGQLEVTCLEISRLSLPSIAQSIYCTMAIGKSCNNILTITYEIFYM